MHIELTDLRQISERLFEHFEQQGQSSVDIPVDYYWNIPKEQVYDPYQEPSELNLGQLTDDWNELQKVLDAKREPIAYYFVWLAAVLRAIGEHVLG